MSRTIILLRHGKAGYADAETDHERTLMPRGREEAAAVGEWMRKNAPWVDAVACSTAARTRETLECTLVDAPVTYSNDLYLSSAGDYLTHIQRTSPEIETLFVVGHEPCVSGLTFLLAENQESALLRDIVTGYPTSGLVQFEFDGDWADLAPRSAQLTAFRRPR